MTRSRMVRFFFGVFFLGLSIGTGASHGQDAARVEAIRDLMRHDKLYEAETGARGLVADTSAVTGQESIETARTIDLLVETLLRLRKGGQPETRQAAERSLHIKQALLAENDLEIAESLMILGQVMAAADDFPAARSNYEQALRIRRAALPPDDPLIGAVLIQLGRNESDRGDYNAARPLYEEALQITITARGESHPAVAGILYNLANLERDIGDFDAAMDHYQRALTITRAAEGPETVHVAYLLDRLADLDQWIGDYASAEPLFLQSLQIRERTFGSDHVEVASGLNNLAGLRRVLGEYGEARSLYERALDIWMRRQGPDNLDTARALDNLAILMAETGDAEDGKPLAREALSIRRRILGPSHPQVGSSLHHLAELLERLGENDEARTLYLEALEVWRNSVGTSHQDYAWTLNSLARLLAAINDTAGARSLYQEALGVWEKAGKGDHPDAARTLEGLGNLLMAAGDYPGALSAYDRALQIRTKAFGQDHPLVAETLGHKASLLARTGQVAAAFDMAARAETISREHARFTIRSLPERQALSYATMRPPARDLLLTLGAAGDQAGSQRAGRAWDAVIRSRAMVLDEMAGRHRDAAMEPGHAGEIVSARQRLANLIVRGPSREPLQQYTRMLTDARHRVETAERSFAQAAAEKTGADRRGVIGLDEVSRALPAGAAIVAYVRYDRLDLGARSGAGGASSPGGAAAGPAAPVPAYAAFVMTGRTRQARAVPLGTAAEIDALVAAWQKRVTKAPDADATLARADLAACRLAGEELRRRIWDPVTKLTAGAARVILIPDGAIHLISFAALPVGADQYLIDRGPSIHYLSAERDLVPSRGGSRPGRGTLALGGPSFDMQPGAVTTDTPARVTRGADDEADADCMDFHSLRFAPLPAAQREVDEIAALMRNGTGSGDTAGRTGDAVEELKGADASEAAFKSKAPGRRVLHIATHGFFLRDTCAATRPAGARGIGGVTPSPGGELTNRPPVNPLLLSGLALAGANMRDSADPNGEDGVLTADEIAVMDLSSADFVVLSACDTGTGEIAAGEGVLGLRRAFQIASGSELVMSLWSVEDEVARQYMNALYDARFVRGLATDRSVEQASRTILAKLRQQGRGSHPFYWGGFVSTGAWR